MRLAPAAPLVLALGAVTTTPAHAQDREPLPELATGDRLGTTSSMAIDASVTLWDEIFGAELIGLGLTVRGQLMTDVALGESPAMAGGYMTLPLGWGQIESPLIIPDGEESDFGIGNLELGGVVALDAGGGSVLVRLGVALPTAEDDDNNAGPILNFPARLTDVVLYPDDTTSLRISSSYLRAVGQLFFRVDAGLDVPFADEDMSAFNDDDPIVRLNLAGGLRLEPVAIMGELVTVGTTGDTADDQDRFFHTFAFTARYIAGEVQPMASLVVPLDDSINDFVDLSVIAGVSASLGI